MLPVRHLLVLHDKTKTAGAHKNCAKSNVPNWVQDYALFLLDADGRIVVWYAGAERIYGYKSDEIIGQHVSVFHPDEDAFGNTGKIEEGRRRRPRWR